VLELVSDDRRSPPLGPLEALQQRLQMFTPLATTTLHGCLIASDGTTVSVKREMPRTAARKLQREATPH
jgi:tRNA(Ile)-lysidine synthase